ncbi:MAG: CHAT domain-containing protein [Polyangia bacterium]
MEPLKVLLLAANPERKNLRLGAEQRDIQERTALALQQLQRVRTPVRMTPIEFLPVTTTRVRDLSRMLRLHAPHVLHFSGHGAAGGELIFETDSGGRAAVTPDVMTALLRPFRTSLRLVLLNACYSQSQAQTLVESIDCCIGMSCAVEDEMALTFAQAFYELIAVGSSVAEAFHLACQELATLTSDQAWSRIPRLMTRSGLDAEEIFLLPGEVPPLAYGPEPAAGEPADSPPSPAAPQAIVRLSALPREQLTTSRLRRIIHEMLCSDSDLTAFLLNRYPRLARQASDNMQRDTKLNILFTHEPNLPNLRRNLLEFWLEQGA